MRFIKTVLALAIGSVALSANLGAHAASGSDMGAGTPGMGAPGMGTPGMGNPGMGNPGMGDEGRPAQRQQGEYRHGGHHRGFGAMSPERMEKRIDRMAERLIGYVDGTPQQQEQISTIGKTAAKDVWELRKQGGELRRQGMDLLKAPTIDRAAIESLRVERMAVMDSVSKRMAEAFADAAEVLTPEQRAKLAERMQSRRGKRG